MQDHTATTEHHHPHSHRPHSGHGAQDDHAVHTAGQHAGHSTAMFKNRFWASLALSLPVVYFSPMMGHLLGYMPPMLPGSDWIPPVLGPVIFLYGGQPFLQGGVQELKNRRPGMMMLGTASKCAPGLGHRLQRHLRAAGRRCARVRRGGPVPGRRCCPDVRVHYCGGIERPTAATGETEPGAGALKSIRDRGRLEQGGGTA